MGGNIRLKFSVGQRDSKGVMKNILLIPSYINSAAATLLMTLGLHEIAQKLDPVLQKAGSVSRMQIGTSGAIPCIDAPAIPCIDAPAIPCIDAPSFAR